MMCIYGVTVHIATSDMHYENGDILNANAKKKNKQKRQQVSENKKVYIKLAMVREEKKFNAN